MAEGMSYADAIIAGVTADSEKLGFTFYAWDGVSEVPEGGYLVALVLESETDGDYHWYRQDEDGYWSHKPGQTEVTNLDASGNLITNPETADRDYGGINYQVFSGYYVVIPNKEYE